MKGIDPARTALLTIDLQNKKITDGAGVDFDFDVDESRRECLLKRLEDIAVTLQFDDRITEYERQRNLV